MAKRLLWLDADATRLAAGRARFTAAGFEVLTAATAAAALELAQRAAPHVVLSDVMLCDFDGFGFCRLVRGEPALSDVPVVLAIESPDPGDHHLAAGVGASELVEHSPDFSVELAAVRRALEAGAPRGHFPPMQAISRDHLGSVSRKMSALVARARRSEARYRRLLDHAQDVIVLVDREGFIIEANQRCARLVGLEVDALRGHHMTDFFAQGVELDLARELAQLVDAKGRNGAPAVPVKLRTADGAVVLLEFVSVVVDVGGERVVMAIGRDVTEHMRAVDALKESESRYRQLVENMPEVLWSMTQSGQFLLVTSNVEQVTGLTPEQTLAEGADGWIARVHPDDLERFQQAHQLLQQRGGGRCDVKYRLRRKDGTYIWLHARASRRPEGETVDGIISDITEQVRLEENLRQAQKLEAVGQLVGGVAHDFNNLLTVILSSAEFLADEGFAPGDPRRELCADIQDAARRAASLTKQLLLFSRKQAPQTERLRPSEVVTNLAKMLRRLIGEDIELVIDDACSAAVEIDRGHLEQVVMNLAVNARDAMPSGGRIDIQVRTVSADDPMLRVAVPPLPPVDCVAVSVTDTGAGIAPEIRDRIFEPFFTTKGTGRGTGLGLSTVFSIVQGGRGGIVLESEVGRGTRFTVLLPAAELRGRAADEGPRTPPRGSEKVMVLEDEPMVSSVIRRILESGGYRVVQAQNAREAFDLLERERDVKLVLSDVVMPGMSGPALTEALRQRRPDLKVVLMSGYSEHPALTPPHVGDRPLVHKPTTAAELLTQVRATLDRAA